MFNRIVFVGVEQGETRTDASFERREQEEHHKGTSPLERDLNLNLPMVSAFRLDGLHLAHGGAFERWL
ncbi:hypothetical protein FOCC_FOCC016151 [Frankliniella occidentalis]|nr:hypothetical protein FOCC_FOCC016151 [Frankliniella occidentalis]